MDVYEAVIKRRSIRWFKNIPVPLKDLERCVNAARLAPSAMNRQVCHYIIVDDEQLLPQVFNSIKGWGGQSRPEEGWPMEKSPRAFIILLINGKLQAELGGNASHDAGLAAENIMLVAMEQGIGSCPATSFEKDKLRPALNIPDKHDIAIVVALGYPDENPVTETATESINRWTDSNGTRHVPKRKLEDIMQRNKFR